MKDLTPSEKHADLKNHIMLDLQMKYKDRLQIFSRSVGKAYFKRGKKFCGPYNIGQTGSSDIYGSLALNPYGIAVSFNIEVKTGSAVLSKVQCNRRDIALKIGIGFFEARDRKVLMKEFIEWDDWIWTKIKA